jgi:hypothetical protein
VERARPLYGGKQPRSNACSKKGAFLYSRASLQCGVGIAVILCAALRIAVIFGVANGLKIFLGRTAG